MGAEQFRGRLNLMAKTTMTQTPANPTHHDAIREEDFIAQLVSAMLLSMGVLFAVVSVAYIQDIVTLREVPNAIWEAMCGRPDPNGPALPLFLTMGALSFIGAGVSAAWHPVRRRLFTSGEVTA